MIGVDISTTDKTADVINNGIPLVFKSSALDNSVLFCEVDDSELDFTGDSGAIGRIYSNKDTLRLDFKGRQYKGNICNGPTVMILNMTTATNGLGGAISQVARVETILNEFVHLEFEKDLHDSMAGVFTGLNQQESDSEAERLLRESGRSSGKKGKKTTKSKRDADDDDEDEVEPVKPKKKAPIISTITNKKRTKVTKSAKKSNSTGSKKGKK